MLWAILSEAKTKGYIKTEGIGNLLHFRQVVYDIFHLLDFDNDNILRKFYVEPGEDVEWDEGDIDDTFWQIIKEQIADPESDQSKNWLNTFQK